MSAVVGQEVLTGELVQDFTVLAVRCDVTRDLTWVHAVLAGHVEPLPFAATGLRSHDEEDLVFYQVRAVDGREAVDRAYEMAEQEREDQAWD